MVFRRWTWLALTLLFTQLSHGSDARQQTVYLLTAVGVNEQYPGWVRDAIGTTDAWMVREFTEHFEGGGYRVVTKRHATQHDLHLALRDPLNVGTLWISHSFGAPGLPPEQGGMTTRRPRLESIEGTDASEIVRATHPNLAFLGLQGCSSSAARELLDRFGIREQNPHLDFYGEDRPLGLETAFRRGINRMARSLFRVRNSYRATGCSNQRVRRGLRAQVTQVMGPNPGRSVGLYRQMKTGRNPEDLLVTLPATTERTQRQVDFEIEIDHANVRRPSHLRLIVDTGVPLTFADLEPGEIGNYHFRLRTPGGELRFPWRLDRVSSGGSKLIFNWEDDLPPAEWFTDLAPRPCPDMPRLDGHPLWRNPIPIVPEPMFQFEPGSF